MQSRWLRALALALLIPVSGATKQHVHVVPLTPQEQKIKHILLSLVTKEDKAIVTGHLNALHTLFPLHSDALRRALKRAQYLKFWAESRGLNVSGVDVGLRTPAIRFLTPRRVQIFGVVSENYHLSRADALDQSPVYDRFGLGIRHDYELVEKDRHWLISADEFTDPLNQDTRLAHEAVPASGFLRSSVPLSPSPGAEKAVEYANTYCGAAPGCGNGQHYNVHYTSYNGEGGDCTNFVSQALLAGGFRMTPCWEYSRKQGEGSPAWVNADHLKHYLQASSRATLYAYGSYAQLTKPTATYPGGAVNTLRPGDLISYIERGRAVHSALVVGYDRFGYPVVDSHTSDRFRVPWDLGWDRHTMYNLWHVHYPKPVPNSLGPRTRHF